MSASASWTTREFAEAVDGIASAALRAAATLRIADHLGDTDLTLDELAGLTGTQPDRLGRMLEFLICRGVFLTRGDGTRKTFANTTLSCLLRSDHPAGLREWLDRNGLGMRMDAAVARIGDALATCTTAYEIACGRPFYADLADSPELGPSFDELRACHGESIAKELVGVLDWVGPTALPTGVASVVDVGGGSGAIAERLLRAQPHLRVTVVDLPSAVTQARQRLERAGLGERATAVATSILDPLPRGADMYLLVNVLHNWDDAEVITILQRCSEAVTASGRVLVVERHSELQDPLTATAMDLRMLAFLGGRERTGREFTGLARDSGLQVAGQRRLLPSGLVALFLRPVH